MTLQILLLVFTSTVKADDNSVYFIQREFQDVGPTEIDLRQQDEYGAPQSTNTQQQSFYKNLVSPANSQQTDVVQGFQSNSFNPPADGLGHTVTNALDNDGFVSTASFKPV